jgi:hypothetical protein
MKKTFTSFSVWALLLAVAVLCYPGAEASAATTATHLDIMALAPLLGLAGMIDIFDTRTMLDVVDQMKRPSTFLRDTFFQRSTQFDTASVDVDIVKGKRRLAPLVNPLAEGRVVERTGFTTNTLKPGYVKPKFVTTAGDLLKRSPGEVLYAGGRTPEMRAQEQLAKDLGELYDMVTRREEWMAAQALTTGEVVMTIKGETADQTVTVDFQMDSNHKVTLTGTDLWSDAGSDPLGDLATWARKCRQDSGLSPTDVLMGSDAAEAFIKNTAVDKELNNRRIDTGMIVPENLPNGVAYLGRIDRPGVSVDLWTYDEWFVDEETGLEGAAIPANKVIMGSRRAQNSKLWGAIQDMDAFESGLVAANRFPKSWTTKDPSVRWLMMQSAPLMALNQPDAFVIATVLA